MKTERIILVKKAHEHFKISACDFLVCPDGSLAIRDIDRNNLLVLAPEEWDQARYSTTNLEKLHSSDPILRNFDA